MLLIARQQPYLTEYACSTIEHSYMVARQLVLTGHDSLKLFYLALNRWFAPLWCFHHGAPPSRVTTMDSYLVTRVRFLHTDSVLAAELQARNPAKFTSVFEKKKVLDSVYVFFTFRTRAQESSKWFELLVIFCSISRCSELTTTIWWKT